MRLVEESMGDVIAQEMHEERYNKKHIDAKLREHILGSADLLEKLKHGVELVQQYKLGEYYESKTRRIGQLANLDEHALVLDMFIGVAYCLRAELFTSVAAQMAARLKFSDKVEAITTVAELLGVLCRTDAFDITKANRNASLMLSSCMNLPTGLVRFMEESQYLPPMVCEPLELVHNYSSGYLTHNDSLLLGSGNHHDGDLCLDVLNTMNRVALRLDTEFLSTVEEEPTFDLDTPDKIDNWRSFKEVSYRFYLLMAKHNNRFYLTHKVDKRGRIYSSGYHINTQGAPFKKAMVELAREEVVTGVLT